MKKFIVSKKKLFDGYTLSAYNKSNNVLNFSPGPSQIPVDVLESMKKDIFIDKANFNYGVTPFEISHRSPEFHNMLNNVNKNLKTFMKIPDDFQIIWTQGGGHAQFSAVPLNLQIILQEDKCKGNYIVTGTWSERSYKEALKFHNVYNSFEELNRNTIPLGYNNIYENLVINNDDGYVYMCSNETVNGTEFRNDGIPYPTRKELNGAKLVVDMCSDLGMKQIDWDNLDVAFCCTSKNFGIAGANILIIRKEILKELENKNKKIPCTLDWNLYDKSNSLYNTPAIFNIYLIDKLLEYYNSCGGVEYFEKMSKEKAKLVYELLDNSHLYKPVVSNIKARSNINIPFTIEDIDVRSCFLEYCYNNNIVGLRTKTPFNYSDFNMIEPLRISLYNGISLEDTKSLIKVMNDFEKMLIVK